MKARKWEKIALVFIILMQCLLILHIADKKQGLHVDEVYSYGLSNSTNGPFVQSRRAFMNNWNDSTFMLEYLAVEEDSTFDYANVVYNQSRDVHPPLFYSLLHTVCSLTPNTFSKWQGISLNLVLFILTQIALFILGKNLFDSEKKALLPVLIYGFSSGATSNVIFIRMYVLLSLICVLFTNINLQLGKSPSNNKLILLMMITILGGLTHYYFYVFAFFISAIYCFYQVFLKNWKQFLIYCVAMFSAIGIAIAIYPSVIDHIFTGSRGTEAFDNLVSTDFIERIFSYLSLLQRQTGIGFYLILAVLGTLIIIKNHKKDISYKKPMILACFIASASFCYILIISKVAPYITDRYMFCVYPLLTLSISVPLIWLYEQIHYHKIVLFVLLGTLLFSTYYGYQKDFFYLYPEGKERMDYISMHSDSDAVIVGEKTWKITPSIISINQLDQFYVTHNEFSEEILNELKTHEESELFLYIINDYEDTEQVAHDIAELLDYSNVDFIFKEGYCMIYQLQK